MTKFRFFPVLVLVAGMAADAWANSEKSISPYTLLSQLGQNCDFDPVCLKTKAQALLNQEDCESREVGAAVLFQLAPESFLVLSEAVSECEIQFWPLHHYLGSWAFSQGNHLEAMNHFVQAENEGMQPVGILTSNIGATYFGLEEWDFATTCMEEAWTQVDSSNLDLRFMILNNLAGLYNRFGEYQQALQWIQLSEENLRAIKTNNPGLTEEELLISQTTIDANKWFAHIGLNDSTFVRNEWRHLNWGAQGITPRNWFKLYTLAAPLIDDDEFYVSQTRNIFSVASEILPLTPTDASTFGNYNALLEYLEKNPDDSYGFHQMWKALTSANALNEQWTRKAQTDASTFDKRELNGTTGMYAVLFALGALGVFSIELKVRQKKKSKAKSIKGWLNDLEQWQVGKATRGEAELALLKLQAMTSSRLEKFLNKQGVRLNESEKIVLQSAELQESPKELAQRQDWSPKYVYSLRSKIRKDLNVPSEMSLEKWLQEKSQNIL